MPQGLMNQHSPFYPYVASVMCDSLQLWSQRPLGWEGHVRTPLAQANDCPSQPITRLESERLAG
jgi:hypothetical protein